MHYQRQDPHELSNTVDVQAINLTLFAGGLIGNLSPFEVLGYCSTHAKRISASRGREKNMGELWRDSIVVLTLLKIYCMYFITRMKTPPRIFRHRRLTWWPLIFITGVHPPSPHPKSPIWQRTVIGLESRYNVTIWLAFDLFDTKKKKPIRDHIILRRKIFSRRRNYSIVLSLFYARKDDHLVSLT